MIRENTSASARGSLRRGFANSTSMAVSSGLLGLAYGASAKSIGMTFEASVAASALIFTGAAQFAVMPLMQAGAPIATVFLVGLLVSMRLFLMGGSLAAGFRSLPAPRQILAIPLISDGSWTVAMSETAASQRFLAFVVAGLWILSNWVIGTGLGHVFAGWMPDPMLEALRGSGIIFLAILLVAVTRSLAAARVLHWAVAGLVAALASLALPMSLAVAAGAGAGGILVLGRVRTAGSGD